VWSDVIWQRLREFRYNYTPAMFTTFRSKVDDGDRPT
jgi:hypothetical protein